MKVPAVAVLTAGAQVPVMPFVEVVGITGAAAPTHTDVNAVKVGTVGAVTVILKVVLVAHRPAVCVNVNVNVPAVAVLTAGAQVPVTPLVDVVGNTGAAAPTQTGAIATNVGTVGAITVRLNVVVVAQSPAVGVKV